MIGSALRRGAGRWAMVLLLTGCAARRAAHETVDPSIYEAEVPPPDAPPRPPQPRPDMRGWDPALREAVARAEARTGVDLHVYGQPGELVPRVGRRVELGPPEPGLVVRFAPLVARHLSLYPPEVRARFVPHLLFVGRLRLDGTPFLGLAHPKEGRFDLALRPGTKGLQLMATLHHEIAHLFMSDPRFDRDGWRAISEGRYVGLRPDTKWNARRPEAWLDAGFVSRYASKNPQEDFAELVQVGFLRPDVLRGWTSTYPKLRAKLERVTAHYARAAPGMLLPWTGEGWQAWQRWWEARRGRPER